MVTDARRDRAFLQSFVSPERPWLFSRNFRVDSILIDSLGHVNNIKWLEVLISAAADHSIAWGWDFVDLRDAGGVWVIHSHNIVYHKPSFEDDQLILQTWLSSFGASRTVREYAVWRPGSSELCVRGHSEWIFVDNSATRPIRIPPAIRADYWVKPTDQDVPTYG